MIKVNFYSLDSEEVTTVATLYMVDSPYLKNMCHLIKMIIGADLWKIV